MVMDFFPINPNRTSWNTSISQSWDVEEATTVSGRRRTLTQQSYPKWVFSLKFPNLSKKEADDLIGFYAKMKGKWGSFFYKDYNNHHVENGELLKQGDRHYFRTNLVTMFEPCYYVENVHIFIDGVETDQYTLEDGYVMLDGNFGVVTATYDYYYLVSFGKNLKVNQIFNDLYSADIDLAVVRE